MKLHLTILSFLVLSVLVGPLLVKGELPQDSLYRIDFNWRDTSNNEFRLEGLQGKPAVLTMAYTRCKSACPLTMQRMKKLADLLSEADVPVNFVIVSLDPERDNPQSMDEFRKHYALKDTNWHLLTGDSESLRKLSVLLSYSYQKKPEGEAGDDIAHSNKIVALDKGGVVVFELEGLGSSLDPLVEEIKKAS